MRTAEVAIEHVLTGLLALCAFLLPLLPGLDVDLKQIASQTEALVGVLGIAYLFGVVFDKIADTLLSPIEQRLRLRLAREFLQRKPCVASDPFPQDALEFSLRGESGRLEWMDSLRGRIRTTRGLAVLGLPAAIGIASYQGFAGPPALFPWQRCWIIAGYLLLMFACVWFPPFVGPMPKTTELSGDGERVRKAEKRMLLRAVCSVLLPLLYAVSMGSMSYERGASRVVAIGVGGAAISLLALWSWYSITGTYMKFIYQQLPELQRSPTTPSS